MYNSQLRKGIMYFLVIFPIYILIGYFVLGTFTGLVLIVIFVVVYKVGVAVEAYRSAKKTENFIPKKYTQPLWLLVYTVAALIFTDLGVRLGKRIIGYQAYSIPTVSMEPTIREGDEIIVTRSKEFQSGDIIAFKDEHDVPLISRIIAMPGDVISITDNQVSYSYTEKTKHVRVLKQEAFEYQIYDNELPNGRRFQIQKILRGNNKLIPDSTYWNFHANMDTMKVPQESVFVLGDNRSNTVDSRYYGPVPIERIIGIARYVYWAEDLERFGKKL